MKLTNSTEKACAVIAMLATQENSLAIPSSVIADRLQISDSYTKKLLRKLVVANLVTATSGNLGGYKLKKKLVEISLLEIVESIEGTVSTYPSYGTLKLAFSDFPKQIEDGENVIKEMFHNADYHWRESLKEQNLEALFKKVFGTRKVQVNWLEK